MCPQRKAAPLKRVLLGSTGRGGRNGRQRDFLMAAFTEFRAHGTVLHGADGRDVPKRFEEGPQGVIIRCLVLGDLRLRL